MKKYTQEDIDKLIDIVDGKKCIRNIKLNHCDLSNLDLNNIWFINTSITNCNFIGADLTSCKFQYVYFDNNIYGDVKFFYDEYNKLQIL